MRIFLLLVLSTVACASHANQPPPMPISRAQMAAVPRSRPAQPPPLLDPRDAEVALYELLNRERERRNIAPLRIDRGLALVAQTTAGEYRRLGRGSEARLQVAADHDMVSFSLTFPVTRSACFFTEALNDSLALHLEKALDPAMHWVGVGVVHSPPPVGPRGGYGVVLTLGE